MAAELNVAASVTLLKAELTEAETTAHARSGTRVTFVALGHNHLTRSCIMYSSMFSVIGRQFQIMLPSPHPHTPLLPVPSGSLHPSSLARPSRHGHYSTTKRQGTCFSGFPQVLMHCPFRSVFSLRVSTSDALDLNKGRSGPSLSGFGQ